MEKKRLKPGKPGLKVIDHRTGFRIPDDGSFVLSEMDTYFFRAIECKDLVEVSEQEFEELQRQKIAAEKSEVSEQKPGGAE